MKKLSSILAAGALALGALSVSTPASALTCTSTGSGVTRTWSLDPATACDTAGGNIATNTELENLGGVFGSTTLDWTKLGDITSGGDASAYLNVSLTSGVWGGPTAAGTWTLTSAFWAAYGEAVIHIHVGGNPQVAPDETAAFLITPGSLSGTWSYSQLPTTGAGGGLSNLTLWGRGPGQTVPVPATAALLGLGLLGLGLARRRAH